MGKQAKHGRGVRIRDRNGKKSIMICFTYQGVICQPTLKNVPVTAANIRFAENMLGEIRNKIAMGTFNFSDFPPIADYPKARLFGHVNVTTYKTAAAAWLVEIEKIKPHSTFKTYKRDLQYSLAVFGQLQLRAIKPGHIRQWILNDLSGLKAKTIRNYVLPLRSVLDQAVNDGVLAASPLRSVVLSKLLTDDQKSPEPAPDPFTREEIDAILAACRNDEQRNMYQFLFYSGLRLSEFMGLEWQDLDFGTGILKIRRAVVMRAEKGPKTRKSAREIALAAAAMTAVNEQKKITFWGKGRIWRRLDGGPLFDYEHINRAWRTCLDRAKVRYRPAKHARHTFASLQLSAGVPPAYIADYLGNSVEMVLRVYGRWISNEKIKPVFDHTKGE